MGPCQSRGNYGPCGEVLKNFICLWLTCLFPGVMLSVCVRERFFFIMSLKWLYILARISLLIFLIWQNKQSETYVRLSGAFWHFNRPWNPKTWKVLCSWVRTQTNKNLHCFILNILFPGCSDGFRLLWSPGGVNFGVSGRTALNGNFCSHGNILCASVCAVEYTIHHVQANMSQAGQTPQALAVTLNSDILWVPSRDELCIQPGSSWPWNKGWKGFGPRSTQDKG